MTVAIRSVLFSLKPYYADLVFEGLKTVEFRRRIASHMEGRDAFIYVSRPIMALRGGFRIGEVWSGTPEDVWHMVAECTRVDKQDFDTYFEGQSISYALEIKEVWECPKPISLRTLRGKFSNFVVPQSWRYVRSDEYQFYRKIRSQIEIS